MSFKAFWTSRLLLLMFLSASIPVAIGQAGRDTAGASDSELVQRFSGSRIVDFERLPNSNYLLALGRMQRVNGRVVAGNEERIQGALTRITYEIPSGFVGSVVFSFFEDQLRDSEAISLFRCTGRGCGSSNYWANDVFDNRILYGPETDQFYLAARVNNPTTGLETYIAVYVITRGNRRVYAHLDISEPRTPANVDAPVTAAGLKASLLEAGSAVVPRLRFDENDELANTEVLDVVVELLLSEKLVQVYIVGHLGGDQALDILMERSQKRAQSVQDALLARGIDQQRLLSAGVGPLAPLCEQAQCVERIELVLQ